MGIGLIMAKGKKLYLILIIAIILVLGIWSAVLDFSRFKTLNFQYDIFPSAILKRINVLLAAAIAWSAGRDSLSRKDSRRMKGVFAFVCLGETFFAFGEREIGVGMFAICQTLLIIRNSTGLRVKLACASYEKKRKLYLTSLVIILILIMLSIVFKSLTKVDISSVTAFLYGIILSISLWAGLACSILNLLPKTNSVMASIGMICFYCCDVLVGLDAILPPGLPWLLANSFIWIFYIPALVLLSLSSYRY